MPPIRAAAYIRVSTDRQSIEGESLEMQEARAREICEAHGWEMLPIYLDVMTGKKDKRPSLIRLEKDLKSGAIDAVICYKVDRLGRTRNKLYELLDYIQQRDIKLVSMTQQFDTTTASGRLMLGILIDFAVYEVEQLGERAADTLLHIAKQGRPPTGVAPYGYRYVPINRETGEGGVLEIVPEEAEGVRLAFDAYLRLGSLSKVALALNSAGYRTRKGRLWAMETVRAMLVNPLYGGERALRRYRKRGNKATTVNAAIQAMQDWELVPANHEPIVPVEVAREVRQAYLRSRLTSPRSRTAGSPWTGMLVCRYCGAKMRRSTPQTSGPVYRCPNRGFAGCEMRTVQEEWLNHDVIAAVSQAVDDARAIQQGLEGGPKGRPVALAQPPNRERQIAALKRKLDRLELRFDNEIIGGDEYLRERKAIFAELEAAQADTPKPSQPPRLILPESLERDWPSLLGDPEGIEIARRLIGSLVSRVIVDLDQGTVELEAVEGFKMPERIEVERWPKHTRAWKRTGRRLKDLRT